MFFQREDCSTQYTVGEVIGTGSFAAVRRAISKSDGSVWAVKVIEKAKLEKEDEEALKVEVGPSYT
jgi:serine/threonine protein kinase